MRFNQIKKAYKASRQINFLFISISFLFFGLVSRVKGMYLVIMEVSNKGMYSSWKVLILRGLSADIGDLEGSPASLGLMGVSTLSGGGVITGESELLLMEEF